MGAGVDGQAGDRNSRAVPTTGMRGGLGRTLLTAFLILTILPLAVIGGYAAQQNWRTLEEAVATKLLAIAALKGESLFRWLEDVQIVLSSSIALDDDPSNATYDRWWSALNKEIPDLMGAAILDGDQTILWSEGECQPTSQRMPVSTGAVVLSNAVHFDLDRTADSTAVVAVSYDRQTRLLCFRREAIEHILETDAGIGETGQVSLIYRSNVWPAGGVPAMDVERAARGGEPRYELYRDSEDDLMMGAYYPLPSQEIAILVEQEYAEVMASTERIMATLIALVLAVALATTAIAAVVIRQITRPVINLTESALAMASGDLDQHLAVKSRDEIGILTYVFNEMAAELRTLYEKLEAKVVERTQRLQRANYQIQRRALHLQASQDVSQAITSVRDPDVLLMKVTDLILNHFVYSSVAVYLVAPGGGEARLQACSPSRDGSSAGAALDNDKVQVWPESFHTGDGSVVERAIRKGEAQVHHEPTSSDPGWYDRVLSRVAVPLKMADRSVGVIAVVTTAHERIQRDELEVLEVLANQVTIALENARAYERERVAMEQMEAAEAFKARFLANMSHELREPLNTIIGFSRLLVKGVEGPLNSRQQEDLQQIHSDSQRLLFLINDILAISQLQAGLMELRLQPVHLGMLVNDIMPTASALVRGKEIDLLAELPEKLPVISADPSRLRQVLVHLLNNAAKFTERGHIKLRAWTNDGDVYVSVSDTGVGIPVEDRERIFAYFEKGSGLCRRSGDGVGLGLSLSKEFVELHGGQIWVDSRLGEGSTFTFSVPVHQPNTSPDANLDGDERSRGYRYAE